MYCEKCGHLLGVTDKFCSECGAPAKYTPMPNSNLPQADGKIFLTTGYISMRAFMYYSLMNIANNKDKK